MTIQQLFYLSLLFAITYSADVKPRYLRSRTGSNTVDNPVNDDGKLKVRALSGLPNGISNRKLDTGLTTNLLGNDVSDPFGNQGDNQPDDQSDNQSDGLPEMDISEPLLPMINADIEYLPLARKPQLPMNYDDAESHTSDQLSYLDIQVAKEETEAVSDAPTAAPTDAPTAGPTAAPTMNPTDAPTADPTAEPTIFTDYFTSEQLSYLDEQVGKERSDAKDNIMSKLGIWNVITCNNWGGGNICVEIPGHSTFIIV